MSQLTIYLPDDVERLVRERARAAGTSLSAFLTGILTREVAPAHWPPALLSVLHEGEGDIAVPEDGPPDELEPLR